MANDVELARPNLNRLPGRRRAAGFSITELMIAVAVAAILATVAVPSFSSLTASQRVKTYSSSLYATIAKTRSEAIALNTNVTLRPASGGWANGWQITGPNGNSLDNRGPASGVTIAGPANVAFTPSGRLPAGTGAPMFVITTSSGSTTFTQCVSVDLGGRPYTKAASSC